MPRIDSSTSAILAEINHDLDEPQNGDLCLDADMEPLLDPLLLAPHTIDKVGILYKLYNNFTLVSHFYIF